jgi:hypothetical protein
VSPPECVGESRTDFRYANRRSQNPMPDTKDLTGDSEYIELKPIVVKEHLLRLFNNQVQRDYNVADFVMVDGNIVIKLKKKSSAKHA